MMPSMIDRVWTVDLSGWVATLVCAAIAGYGVHMLITAVGWRWAGLRPGPTPEAAEQVRRYDRWIRRCRAQMSTRQMAHVACALLAALFAWSMFAAPAVAVVVAVGTWWAMHTASRAAAHRRSTRARDVWPDLLERVRLEVVGAGRSLPAALLAAGERTDGPLREAFRAARREWVMTSDFAAMLDVLTEQLQQPVADMVAETLLVAHELGGPAIDRRLRALAEDRRRDAQDRKDALARQAGVWFVNTWC